MLKYIIFILVFNVLCFAKELDFDIYEISDRKPVAKRQLPDPVPSETTVTKPNVIPQRPSNVDSVKKDLTQKPNVIPQRPSNVDSVKKDLTQKENSNSPAINPQDASKKDSHVQTKKEDASENQTDTKTQNDKITVSDIEEAKNNSSLKNTKHVEHPGAALRGFYVFLGLSILIIIYFIFKAFRLRPGAPPPTTVRKYGIVGRRSDMEMLPLPLAEEEDDDTLFDMGTQINR